MTLRPALKRVKDALLAKSKVSGEISLNEVGDALGAISASTDEIDALITALEAAGRTVDSPKGGHGEESLRLVLTAARALRTELGRNPSPYEISVRSELSIDRVLHALNLAKIIAR